VPSSGSAVPDGVLKWAVWLQGVNTVTPQVKASGEVGEAGSRLLLARPVLKLQSRVVSANRKPIDWGRSTALGTS